MKNKNPVGRRRERDQREREGDRGTGKRVDCSVLRDNSSVQYIVYNNKCITGHIYRRLAMH